MPSQHPLLAESPTRVAFAGDWHGNTRWATGRIMSAAAHGVDVLVQVGDFGIWPGSAGERYLDAVERTAARGNLNVLFLDGNHEDFTQLAALEPVGGLGYVRDHIWHVPRGTRWTWNTLRFAALGGATSLDRALRTPGVDWWPQEAITEAQAAEFAAGGPCDVAITHDRPAGVEAPGITRESGVALWGEVAIDAAEAHSRLLADALIPTRPALVFHGHLHTRYTVTWHYPGGHGTVEGLDCDGSTAERGMIVRNLMAMTRQVREVRADD